MRVGILGGTFNPPHLGHLILAQAMKETLKLNKVMFIPTNRPPHKNTYLVAARYRLKMVKLAIKDNPCFELLDWEVKQKGVSYTINTLKFLKNKFKRRRFFLIIGSELANDFNNWKDYKQIQRLVKIAVGRRSESPLKKKNNFMAVDIPQIAITSSLVREHIARGLSVKYLVPKGVFDYIKKNKLYLKQ
jgi:nicotinate-nucleotide adenylyltransferase